jgi:hypothetical protein
MVRRYSIFYPPFFELEYRPEQIGDNSAAATNCRPYRLSVVTQEWKAILACGIYIPLQGINDESKIHRVTILAVDRTCVHVCLGVIQRNDGWIQ